MERASLTREDTEEVASPRPNSPEEFSEFAVFLLATNKSGE